MTHSCWIKSTLLASLLLCWTTAILAFPADFSVDNCGAIKLDNIDMHVLFYDRSWNRFEQSKSTVIPEGGYPHVSPNLYELKGQMRLGNTPELFTFQQWLRQQSDDTVNYSMRFWHETGAPTNVLCVMLELPASDYVGKTLLADNSEITLSNQQDATYPVLKNVKRLEIPCNDKLIVLTGNINGNVTDHRQFKVATFTVRLLFSQHSGLIKESTLDFNIAIKSRKVDQLDLSTATSADNIIVKPDNAAKLLKAYGLREYQPSFSGVTFTTPDPREKTGAILNLGSEQRAKLTLTPEQTGNYLYLLHTVTDQEAKPQIHAIFSDQSEQVINLTSDNEYTFTKPPKRQKNGVAVAVNNDNFAALFVSLFKLDQPDLQTLNFVNQGTGEWIIAGASLGKSLIPLSGMDNITFILPDHNWTILEDSGTVKPGSALDFSTWLDAPAGKYGAIKVGQNGHFVANDRRIRFLGANLCFSGQFLSKPDAENLADEFARLGYNSVRFHHFDNELSTDQENSTNLDPERLDQLDYLFYCMKERGIYITIDIYCSRNLRENELPEIPNSKGRSLKASAAIHPAARENWKTFARNFLGHRNTYTGLTWAEDPALYSVCLSNETVLYGNHKHPDVGTLYVERYIQWLKEQNLDTEPNRAARGGLWTRFINELHVALIKDFSAFLRNELNYQGLVTDVNFQSSIALTGIRDKLDFVDNHSYWDHPYFLPGKSWSFPYVHNMNSILSTNLIVPRMLFGTRIFGKPFTLTELNFTYPNPYRAEYGPVIGAYAALQDWDGLYRFSWSHSRENTLRQRATERFDIVRDPLSHIAERIVGLMFLRGDVDVAPDAVALPYGDFIYTDSGLGAFPPDFLELGLYCRIGSLAADSDFPGVRMSKEPTKAGNYRDVETDAMRKALSNSVKTSETGQIVYDQWKRRFTVVTPRLESLILSTETAAGEQLAVSGVDGGDLNCFQVITAASLDAAPLAKSENILLFQQTDVTSNRIRYSSEHKNAVEHWGTKELLLRRAAAQVRLKIAMDNPVVLTLKSNGEVSGVIPSTYRDSTLEFVADTGLGTMIYQIIPESKTNSEVISYNDKSDFDINQVQLTGKTDRNPLSYQPGDTIKFILELNAQQPLPEFALSWQLSDDFGQKKQGQIPISREMIVETTLNQPGFVRLVARLVDQNGQVITKTDSSGRVSEIVFDGGAAVQLELLQACPEPEDFDAFWSKQKERLSEIPLTVEKEEVTGASTEHVAIYAVQVSCVGGRPLTGYLAIPRGAKEQSLPAVVNYPSYGANKPGFPPTGDAKRILFHINAHGFKLGQDDTYYQEFASNLRTENGRYNYGYNPEQNTDPETTYWHGVALRALRASQFVKSLPEWDGKNLTVSGSSQGGMQSIWVAGLDPDVTFCRSNITWCCDLEGASRFGRQRGSGPVWQAALSYYDPVFHARRIKCPVEITRASLGDYVSPPSGIAVLWNQLQVPAKITWFQNSTHGRVPAQTEKFTQNK